MRKQAGFGVVEILIVVALIAVIAVGGWYVWQKNQTSPTKQSSTSQATAPTSTTAPSVALSNQDKLAVPATWNILEWHVMATNGSQLHVQYRMSGDNRKIYFTSSELATAAPTCDLYSQSGNLKTVYSNKWVSRYASAEIADVASAYGLTNTSAKDFAAYLDGHGYKANYKKVGDYYYFFGSTQNSCSSNPVSPFEPQTDQAIKDILASFMLMTNQY